MNSFDSLDHRLVSPIDNNGPARAERLRELNLGDRPDPAFDEFARHLAQITGAPYSMVNFLDDRRQYFGGLYTSEGVQAELPPGETNPRPSVGREMPLDHGYCPHVIVRRKALVLEDVCDYPRFAGNPVVDEIGIRSYMGAPLLDSAGMPLGTVCVVDREPRPWGHRGLDTIKEMARTMTDQLRAREQEAGG